MNEHMKRLLDWCHEERIEARKALALYEQGRMTFRANNVDVTEEQKASLRRIIDDLSRIIDRIEADESDSFND
jgi:hypothetical protein